MRAIAGSLGDVAGDGGRLPAHRAEMAGLSWPLPESFDDARLDLGVSESRASFDRQGGAERGARGRKVGLRRRAEVEELIGEGKGSMKFGHLC